jgi:hypothetical protein
VRRQATREVDDHGRGAPCAVHFIDGGVVLGVRTLRWSRRQAMEPLDLDG